MKAHNTGLEWGCWPGRAGAHQQVGSAARADARRVQPLEIHVLALSLDALDASTDRASGGEELPQAAGDGHQDPPPPPPPGCPPAPGRPLPYSPWGQLVGRHAPEVVGAGQLQRAAVVHTERIVPLHAHQHAADAATAPPQQEHLDLWGAGGPQLEGEPCVPRVLPEPLSPPPSPASPPCWPWSCSADWRPPPGSAWPPSGLRRSHRGGAGSPSARPGTGTGPGGRGRSVRGGGCCGGLRAGAGGLRACCCMKKTMPLEDASRSSCSKRLVVPI